MNEDAKQLVLYRLEQVDESISSAKLLFEHGSCRPVVNRAYYAMFYSILAVLVTTGFDVSKHSGVISIFDREFVKKGVFPKEFSKWLHEAFDLRQRADYTELFTISRERTAEILRNAELFTAGVRRYLANDGI